MIGAKTKKAAGTGAAAAGAATSKSAAKASGKSDPKNVFRDAPSRSGVDLAPSILSADFARLGHDLALCRRAATRWIHVDVMDGHFVPNLTFGPALVESISRAEPQLFYDTHLMLDSPMEFAEAFVKAGSHLITIHAEASADLKRDLRALRRMGALAGVSIRPKTGVKVLKEILPLADLVLVMTVEPGFGGQALIPTTLNKVRELDLLRREAGLKFRLQVDGGVTAETAPLAVAAGADVLVAGSAVFSGGRVAENLAALRKSLGEAPPIPRRAVAKAKV